MRNYDVPGGNSRLELKEGVGMILKLEAVFENGVLRFDQPLPLREHERVTIRIERPGNPVDETYGIIGWTGPVEVLRKFAEDDEFGIQESP